MSATSPWKTQLCTPHPCDHVVQLYTDPSFLAAAVAHFVGSGLAQGEAAVIIATPAHVELFTRALTAEGFDVRRLAKRQQFVALDAADCLSRFMVDGMPDRGSFRELVQATLDQVRSAGYAKIRLYGEMVDLLWNHNLEATAQLEELWNEVLADTGLSLLCAYHIDPFDHHAYRGLLHRISRSHSYLIPVDDYDRFDHAVGRAFTDVFGAQGDPEKLRELLIRSNRLLPAMPSAQAALFALRDLPASVGDAVLERARQYYGA
jgi:superfamily I DNA/RNA helicase